MIEEKISERQINRREFFKTARNVGILAFTGGFSFLALLNRRANADQEVCTYPVTEETIYGPVHADVRCDYTYADRLPAGDLRIGAGVTLNSPSEVSRFIGGDSALLLEKSGRDNNLLHRLSAASYATRTNLADFGWNIDLLNSDNVIGKKPLFLMPQFLIETYPHLQDQILADFARKGMRVEERNGVFILTEGVVPQAIANPQNLGDKMFIFAKIVSQNLHNLSLFRFGNHEEYWVLAEEQQMEDGRIRYQMGSMRNDCANINLFEIEVEQIPPEVPAEEEMQLGPTPVPAVSTPAAPPVQVQVPSIPTATLRPTITPQETPEIRSSATPQGTPETRPSATPQNTPETRPSATPQPVPPTGRPTNPPATSVPIRPTALPSH